MEGMKYGWMEGSKEDRMDRRKVEWMDGWIE